MKKETIEEFLARGGKIQRFATVDPEVKEPTISSTNKGPAVILTLDDGNLYYGEGKVSKTKKKSSPKIDLSALPEAIRNKYCKGLADDGE